VIPNFPVGVSFQRSCDLILNNQARLPRPAPGPPLTGAHGVSPARHDAHGSSRSAGGGQGHGLHVIVQGGGLFQLDQHDVVVDVVGAVLGVTDDAGGGDVLLGSFGEPDVVLAQTHLHATGMRARGGRQRERERL